MKEGSLKRFICRRLRRSLIALVSRIPAPKVDPYPAMATPRQKTRRVLPTTLLCPVCEKPLNVRSLAEVWCSNPACPELFDLCRVTFVMHPLKERTDEPTPPS